MGAEERVSAEANVITTGPGQYLDLDHLFAYHPPTPEQVALYEAIREMGKTFAVLIGQVCPPNADRTHAINSISDAVMKANRSIAVHLPTWPPAETDGDDVVDAEIVDE